MEHSEANTPTAKRHPKRRPAPSIPSASVQPEACNDLSSACGQQAELAKGDEDRSSSVNTTNHVERFSTQIEDTKYATVDHNPCANGNRITISKHQFDAKKVPVHVNLPVKCNHLIELLQRLHFHMEPVLSLPDGTVKEAILQRSIFRYETLWLPLSAEHRLYSGAPVDVQWLWLAHMLNPVAYRLDCQRITGTFVNHRLVSQKRFYKLTQQTRKLWNLRYPEQPFAFIANDSATESVGEALREHGSHRSHKISRELLRSVAERLHEFLYQVSLPHFRQTEFLREASLRYQKYLFLRKLLHCQHPTSTKSVDTETRSAEFEVPVHLLPTDIDLCWRVHIHQPGVYSQNTGCLFGKLLPYHSDQERDDSRDSSWVHQFDVLWRQEFPGEPLFTSGCCRRLMSGKGVFQTLDSAELYNMSTKCAAVVIKSITPWLPHSVDKFAITIRRTALRSPKENESAADISTDFFIRLTSADFSRHRKKTSGEIIRKQSAGMRMISGICDVITLELIDKRGWICPSNAVLGFGELGLTEMLETFMGTETLEREFNIPIREEFTTDGLSSNTVGEDVVTSSVPANGLTSDHYTMHPLSLRTSFFRLSLAIDPPIRHAVHLQVKLGAELVCQLQPPIPGSSGIWGPVTASPSLSTDKDQHSEGYKLAALQGSSRLSAGGVVRLPNPRVDIGRSLVLLHRIINHNKQLVFTVRVLHNVALGLSVVHIYSGQKLLAIGHQLHLEHLPELRKTKRSKQYATKLNRTFNFIKTRCFNKSKSHNTPENRLSQDFLDTTDQPESNLDSAKEQLKPGDPATWCLQPGRSERAMLVKDQKGDWCLLVGSWTGFRRQPSQASDDAESIKEAVGSNDPPFFGTRSNCGQLSLRARWLAGSAQTDVSFAQIPDSLNNQSIVLKDMSVNMKTGKIIIGRTCNDVAQYVCLAFCCSILHVVCQPRIISAEISGELLSPVVERQEFAFDQHQSVEDKTVRGSLQQLFQYQSVKPAPETPTNNCLPMTSTASKRMSRLRQPKAVIQKYAWSVNPMCQADLSTLSKDLFGVNVAHLNSVIGEAKIHCSNVYVRHINSSLIEDKTDGFSLNLPNFRKPMASLFYVMCRASGLPFDALIPSVQYLRYLKRFGSDCRSETLELKHTASNSLENKVVHQNSSNVSDPVSLRTRTLPIRLSRSAPKETFTSVTELCDSYYSNSMDNKRANYYRTLRASIGYDGEERKFDSFISQNDKRNLPHIGFRLVDFYDLFLLQLPDICSGCVDGCRYCNGPAAW